MIAKKIGAKYKRRYYKLFDNFFGKSLIKNHTHASPDFIIIGTQKGGTTSLFQYLAQHPEILPPKEKELAYFAWNRSKGLDWYLNNFPLKNDKKNKLTFEATPAYVYLKDAPVVISKFFPNLKSILLLRDPVWRAYSHWQFYHESKFVLERPSLRDKRSFEEAVLQEIQSPKEIKWHSRYLDRGKYANQIKNWQTYYDKEQMLILDSEELKSKPQKTLTKITDFLLLSDYFQGFDAVNKNIEGLLDTIDKSNNKKLNNYNTNKYKSRMSSKVEAELRDYFSQSDDELWQLTSKKFSWMDKKQKAD